MSFSQKVARPIRTGLQLVSAGVVVEFVDSTLIDLSDRQYAATTALLTMLIGAVQVAVEDHTGKALLREPRGPNVAAVETTSP